MKLSDYDQTEVEKMQKRKLGNSNLEVSALGLGCMRMSHDEDPIPVPGSRKLHRLDENISSIAVELTPNDLREIKSAISQITIQGDRYPEELKKQTGR